MKKLDQAYKFDRKQNRSSYQFVVWSSGGFFA